MIAAGAGPPLAAVPPMMPPIAPSARLRDPPVVSRGSTTSGDGFLARTMRAFEKRVIARALRDAKGNIGDAAEALGISRRALENKMGEYELREEAARLRERSGIPGPRTA